MRQNHAGILRLHSQLEQSVNERMATLTELKSEYDRISKLTEVSQDGTGLGLPLTKALVELHGGVLDLQSEVNVGTTVTVACPDCFP